jgi:hypothetical protein
MGPMNGGMDPESRIGFNTVLGSCTSGRLRQGEQIVDSGGHRLAMEQGGARSRSYRPSIEQQQQTQASQQKGDDLITPSRAASRCRSCRDAPLNKGRSRRIVACLRLAAQECVAARPRSYPSPGRRRTAALSRQVDRRRHRTGIMHHVDQPARVIGEMLRVARTAIIVFDHNNYAFGGGLARRLRMGLKLCGLLGVASYVKQGLNRSVTARTMAGGIPTLCSQLSADRASGAARLSHADAAPGE